MIMFRVRVFLVGRREFPRQDVGGFGRAVGGWRLRVGRAFHQAAWQGEVGHRVAGVAQADGGESLTHATGRVVTWRTGGMMCAAMDIKAFVR